MATREKLSSEAIDAALAERTGWTRNGDRLQRKLKFSDFNAAFGFMTRVALVADKLDHHPNWSNVYDRVEIELWTHDAGGITALDFQLAARIDEFAAAAGAT
jgi:4a-hydroxytetrahydrobiopterin dehydratase